MGTYLDKILTAHRLAARDDDRRLDQLVERALDTPTARGFRDALGDESALSVIAEIKRRSPSKGDLAIGLDPVELAAVYQRGGASCLSVLTDVDFFGGSPDDLIAARGAVSLPVLRKDFTVDARDICDARLMGADCVLLIVAALDDSELADFSVLAHEVGVDVLVEVHDEAELERAITTTDADMIGVNQRDLVTFEVDTERAVRVAAEIPDGVVKVAESGVSGREAATTLTGAGYDAVLVGEHLVTAADTAAAVRDLIIER